MKLSKFVLLVLVVLCVGLVVYSISADETKAEDKPTEGDTTTTISDEPPIIESQQTIEQLDTAINSSGDKKTFQAEIKQLLSIIINSLYSNKDIFLRELISNASDALDKIRFISLKDKKALDSNSNLEVRITADKDNNRIIIRDTGIGMTKSDLENNLGTIAKSGTKQFMQQLQEGKVDPTDSNLIGQFGVGFYSAYLVADRVTVITKNNDDKQYIWQSTADSSYSIAEDPRGDTLGRGTEIILDLKSNAKKYLKDEELKKLIQTYSEFIQFPIFLYETKTETKEVPVEEEKKEEEKKVEEEQTKDEEKKEEDDVKVEDEKKEEEKKDEKKMKTITETKSEWSRINDNKPIWTRPPSEITSEEYTKFYKSISKDPGNPITQIHFKAEGSVDFRALLYIPEVPPFNMFDFTSTTSNIKLYVKRVFISDQLKDMMPRYLNFIRGIVDSEDLPLNISREMLQQSRLMKLIKRRLVTKIVSAIKKLSEEDKKARKRRTQDNVEKEQQEKDSKTISTYKRFWDSYGKNIRLGVTEDTQNKQLLLNMLRFKTSKSPWETISLSEYIERMKEGQKKIYYIAAENEEKLRNSPYLEEMLRRGIEVLYMTDAIDEYMLQSVSAYDGKDFQSLQKDGLELGDEEEKKEFENQKKVFEPLTTKLKEIFADDKKLMRVDISQRINTSPCVIIAPTHGYSANMLRIMRAQTLGTKDYNQLGDFAELRILEINPKHPLVNQLNERVKINPNDTLVEDLGKVLYDTAKLRSGYEIKDTAEYANKVFTLINEGMSVPPQTPETQTSSTQDKQQEQQEQPKEEEEVVQEQPKEENLKDEL